MEYVTKQMQTYRTGKTITDQFYIDDDYNVPDAKSDVKRVILGEGTLAVEDMKIVENYIRVAGKLNFKVLYVTDEGETRLSCLEALRKRFPSAARRRISARFCGRRSTAGSWIRGLRRTN